MAQRDYVRKRAKPKKRKSRILAALMLIIALALVGLFIAVLYFISANKSAKPSSSLAGQVQPPAQMLPEKPQERWTYLKELENPNGVAPSNGGNTSPSLQQQNAKERQQALDAFMNNGQTTAQNTPPSASQPITPPPAAAKVETGKWIVRCGAFKERQNAETLKAQIAMSGLNSSIQSDGLYRVTVGTYTDKSQADSVIATLKNSGISSCIVANK